MRSNDHWHPAHIRALRDLTPTVREFEIRPEGGVRPWTVGSHLNVRLNLHPRIDGRDETRSYSLTGQPHDPGAREVYRIAVKRVEPGRGGSRHLWSLERGAELMVGEPAQPFRAAAGRAAVPAGRRRHRHHADRRHGAAAGAQGADVQLLYAARSADELAFADALRARARRAAAHLRRRARASASTSAAELAALPTARAAAAVLRPAAAARRRARGLGRAPAARRRTCASRPSATAARTPSEAFWVELPRHGLRFDGAGRPHAARRARSRRRRDAVATAGAASAACARWTCSRSRAASTTATCSSARTRRPSDQRLCACVSRVTGGAAWCWIPAYRPD